MTIDGVASELRLKNGTRLKLIREAHTDPKAFELSLRKLGLHRERAAVLAVAQAYKDAPGKLVAAARLAAVKSPTFAPKAPAPQVVPMAMEAVRGAYDGWVKRISKGALSVDEEAAYRSFEASARAALETAEGKTFGARINLEWLRLNVFRQALAVELETAGVKGVAVRVVRAAKPQMGANFYLALAMGSRQWLLDLAAIKNDMSSSTAKKLAEALGVTALRGGELAVGMAIFGLAQRLAPTLSRAAVRPVLIAQLLSLPDTLKSGGSRRTVDSAPETVKARLLQRITDEIACAEKWTVLLSSLNISADEKTAALKQLALNLTAQHALNARGRLRGRPVDPDLSLEHTPEDLYLDLP